MLQDGKFQLDLPGGGSCDCAIRVSRRCRNASLRVSSLRGLELALPPSYSLKRALEFARGNAAWVERTLKRRAAPRQAADEGKVASEEPLPHELDLKASGEVFHMDYLNSPGLGFISVRIDAPGRLTVQGDLQKTAACQGAIIAWLRLRAEKVFLPCAKAISAECRLDFISLRIRDQKGRWGSCSKAGRINLNFRLLLLEPKFLRHVIVHELCHRAELNHSKRFWTLVERFDPGAKATAKELNKASAALPSWLRLG